MSKKSTPKRGRPGCQAAFVKAYGKADFLPALVKDTEGVSTMPELIARIAEKTGVTVAPIPLRNMVRKTENLRRVKKSSSLFLVVNIKRGRPALATA